MMRARAFALALVFAAMAAHAQSRVAEVERVDGKGEYREARATSWRPAAIKQSLFANDFVRTLDVSKMAILFADGSRAQLAPNSQMQFRDAGAQKTNVDFNSGRGWFNSPGGAQPMRVQTPGAVAAIRGTEWEIAVDGERTTLSVFAGEVELSNEHGQVVLAAYEQGIAERGKAPVKLQLRISRDRIQWVSSFTVDARRYGEVPQVERLVQEQRLDEAYAFLRGMPESARSAAAWLLLADFEVYRGDLAAAEEVLARGARAYPADERFDVAASRVALFADRPGDALARARRATEKRADSVEALLALGDVERNRGRAREALAAYARAAQLAAKDARPWYGLGAVQGERENVRRARSHLEKAITLDPGEARYVAELGTVEGFAGRLDAARAHLRKAISLRPDDYVAWTGLGVVELRSGNTSAALDALSRATLLEPRYARAQLYIAAAYYQTGNDRATLEALDRAAELDPNDPLPHLLASMVYLDRVEPGRAAQAAQRALERIPYLKSANQVADNQKGIANAAYPLAYMGLEAWSRSAAHDSYLPRWGGSHLFLADRYPGAFNRRSELVLGFLTDPLVFGASNRHQSLFITPGHHATLALGANHSSDLDILYPVATLNGHVAGGTPFSYFAEASDVRVEPRGLAFEGRQRSLTLAAGAKPSHELGIFVFAAHVRGDFEIGRELVFPDFERTGAESSRVDAGLAYSPNARSITWAKVGAGQTRRTTDFSVNRVVPGLALVQEQTTIPRRDEADVAVRHTREAGERLAFTLGAEVASLRNPTHIVEDVVFHMPGTAASRNRGDFGIRDRSQAAYGIAQARLGALRAEGGIAYAEYRADRDVRITSDLSPGQETLLTGGLRRRKGDPMLGLVWQAPGGAVARAMCRRWLRPLGLDTLAPLAIAGLPVDDQLVLRGGELEQCRVQFEMTLRERVFAMAFADHVHVRNIFSDETGFTSVGEEATNVERLRNRVLSPPRRPDQLEGEPVFGRGTVRRAGVAFEALVTRNLGARVHYTYTDSRNDDAEDLGFSLRIPYLPRHQTHIGATWSPGWRTVVTAQAVHRSRRFTDEFNRAPFAPGWDGHVRVFVEGARKDWAVELTAANLFKKDVPDLFGIVVSYRF